MKKRIEYIDLAKGLAIIGVVLSHAITNCNDVYSINHPILLNFISMFNVATFFFINGFLYNDKCVITPFKAILKKFKAYYIPLISFNFFFLVIYNLTRKCHIISSSKEYLTIKTFLIELIKIFTGKLQSLAGPLWFLRALIVLTILYIIIDSISSRIHNGKYRYIINFLVSVLLYILARSGVLPAKFNFDSGCSAMIVFFFGVYYRHKDLSRFTSKYSYVLFSVSLITTIIIANFSYVGINKSINPVLDILAKISSVTMIISLSQIPQISRIIPLKVLGAGSLEIMALHILSFKPVSLLIIYLNNLEITYLEDNPIIRLPIVTFGWSIVYTLSGLILPVVFYKIKKRFIH